MSAGENLKEPGVDFGSSAQVTLSGLGTLPAEWTGSRGDKGVVTGVRAVPLPTKENLGNDVATMSASSDKVEYLMKHGYLIVQLAALKEEKAEAKGDAKDGKDEAADTKPKTTEKPRALNKAELEDVKTANLYAHNAHGNFNKALASIGIYNEKAPGLLDKLQSDFDSTTDWTAAAYEQVQDEIKESAKIEALKKEIRTAVIAGITAGFGGGFAALGEAGAETSLAAEVAELPLPKEALTQSKGYFELAWDARKDLEEMGTEAKEKVSEVAEKAKGESAGQSGVDGATPAWAQVAFYKQLAALQAISTNQIVPLYKDLASFGEPIGDLFQATKDALAHEQTISDWPVDRMKKAASKTQTAAATLQKAAAQVPALVESIQGMVTRAATVMPAGEKEIEREVWIRWVAQLDDSDKEKLEQSVLRDYLEKAGVWSQLGIHNPDSKKQDNLAVWSARAQAKVLGHKGESVAAGGNLKEPAVDFGGWPAQVTLSDLGTVAAEWIGGERGDKAVVSGVRAIPLPTQENLGKDVAHLESASDKVEYLLKHGYIIVQLKVLKEEKAEAPKDPGKDKDDDTPYIYTAPMGS